MCLMKFSDSLLFTKNVLIKYTVATFLPGKGIGQALMGKVAEVNVNMLAFIFIQYCTYNYM